MHARAAFLDTDHPLRPAAEAMIRAVYEKTYQARIAAFPPVLAAWIGSSGEPEAACGLRTAADGFFSECYLAAPIEHVISSRFDVTTRRIAGLEITTLATIAPGSALALIDGIVPFAREIGTRWAFFTATRRLRLLLQRAGLRFEALVPADPDCLEDASAWGSYYETEPWVCAIHAAARPLAAFRAPRLLGTLPRPTFEALHA